METRQKREKEMWLEWLVENHTVVSRRELTNDVRQAYTGED